MFKYWKKCDIHQAGSNSLVSAEAFFDLINKGIITTDELKDYENILYDFGEGEDNNKTISYVPFSNLRNYKITFCLTLASTNQHQSFSHKS